MIGHAHLFAFESDFVSTLRCVPMAVRYKLDLVGVKLSLRQWSRFGVEDRRTLLQRPCAAPDEIVAYRACLLELIALRSGEAAASMPADVAVALTQAHAVPEQVNAFAAASGAPPLPDEAWRRLAPLQRFTLVKLSRDNHDNVNFIPAMREFGLSAQPGLGQRAAGLMDA